MNDNAKAAGINKDGDKLIVPGSWDKQIVFGKLRLQFCGRIKLTHESGEVAFKFHDGLPGSIARIDGNRLNLAQWPHSVFTVVGLFAASRVQELERLHWPLVSEH